ncbi:MAG TPA: aminotransferase class V-fold PLP-dependent enzyme [Verrucomicrobiae bacterium]|jgi:isopenicillin-N epimerase|nr:aminotransferase class V-fold PLP-dependent enzyme [Verrucomicrobiae bacterium]
MTHTINQPACDPALWLLDPQVIFLNHGSFGACPRAVLDRQREFRERMERQPVQFLHRELEGLLETARGALAQFLGADPANLVFVSNATEGVNTVLRSLEFKPGDELLVTDQEYNACRNALNFTAARAGATVTVAEVPFPLKSPDDVVAAILSRAGPRTRLALLDHVTSQTGMVLPLARLVKELAARGIDTLVDGAHAPGMVPLNMREIGAAYYTGNCHKWLCAPKTAGFLHVRADLQKSIHPLSISHGANSPRSDRSRFELEFGWTGTLDPSARLCVAESLHYVGSLLAGGWPEIMARNRDLALAARELLCRALRIEAPCPAECIGSLAAVPLPDMPASEKPLPPLYLDPLQNRLREKHGIEVPILYWPAYPKRLLRISAQLYNSLPQYELLAGALQAKLG